MYTGGSNIVKFKPYPSPCQPYSQLKRSAWIPGKLLIVSTLFLLLLSNQLHLSTRNMVKLLSLSKTKQGTKLPLPEPSLTCRENLFYTVLWVESVLSNLLVFCSRTKDVKWRLRFSSRFASWPIFIIWYKKSNLSELIMVVVTLGFFKQLFYWGQPDFDKNVRETRQERKELGV